MSDLKFKRMALEGAGVEEGLTDSQIEMLASIIEDGSLYNKTLFRWDVMLKDARTNVVRSRDGEHTAVVRELRTDDKYNLRYAIFKDVIAYVFS